MPVGDKPDYETKIKPWLGDSIGFAVMEGKNDVVPVIAIQTTDKGKAEEFFKAEAGRHTVGWVDNTAVLWLADDITVNVDDIKKSPIAESADYKADMAKLGGSDYLGTMWAGSAAIRKAAQQGVQSSGVPVTDIPDSRVAAGLKAENDNITLKASVYSAKAVKQDGSIKDFVGSLDGNSVGAFGASISEDTVNELWKQLEPMLGQQPQLGQLFTSVDDLKALLGSKVAASVNFASDAPQVGVKSESHDPAKQGEILDKILSEAMPGLERKTEGNVTAIGYGMTADSVLNPSTKLSDNAAYKKAIDGVGNPTGIVWVDLQRVTQVIPEYESSVPPEAKEALAPLAGVALVANTDGTNHGTIQLKVVAK